MGGEGYGEDEEESPGHSDPVTKLSNVEIMNFGYYYITGNRIPRCGTRRNG